MSKKHDYSSDLAHTVSELTSEIRTNDAKISSILSSLEDEKSNRRLTNEQLNHLNTLLIKSIEGIKQNTERLNLEKADRVYQLEKVHGRLTKYADRHEISLNALTKRVAKAEEQSIFLKHLRNALIVITSVLVGIATVIKIFWS